MIRVEVNLRKNGNDTMNETFEVEVIAETDKAFNVEIQDKGKGWLPKSKCTITESIDGKMMLTAPDWAMKNFGTSKTEVPFKSPNSSPPLNVEQKLDQIIEKIAKLSEQVDSLMRT